MTGIHARFRHRLGDFELNADLECPGQGVTALFGPSGSGKTTLLNQLGGLDVPTAGVLRYRDTDLAHANAVPAGALPNRANRKTDLRLVRRA